MTANAQFWDRTADRYSRSKIKNMDAYEATLDRVRAYLDRDFHMLELGCGTGTTALLLADAAETITATDISSRMCEIGREKAKSEGVDNVNFVEAAPENAPVREGGYDVVGAFNLLHLLQDRPAAYAAVRARLKPGGLFISKTTCLKGHYRLLRSIMPLLRVVRLVPYFSALSVEALEAEIEQAGFEIIETGNYPDVPPSRFVVARKTG